MWAGVFLLKGLLHLPADYVAMDPGLTRVLSECIVPGDKEQTSIMPESSHHALVLIYLIRSKINKIVGSYRTL